MARNYEQADHQFWQVAEAALRVRYDEAVLETKEEAGREEPFSATVRRERGTQGWRAGDEYEVWYLEVRGATREAAIEALQEKCREHLLRAGFATMLQALPYEEAQRIERYATLLLEARHAVVVTSKGTSVEDLANNIKQRWYADLVRDHVEEIKDAIKDGEITTSEEVYDRIREMEVVYTGQAQDILRYSSNDDAYEEETGEKVPDWSTLAAYALQADVTKNLGFEPSDIHEVDCPRCGTVVSTEDESDETDCPKCGIDLSTEVREGFHMPDPPCPSICEDCAEKNDNIKDVRVAPNTEFDCVECDGHFLTAPAKAQPAPAAEIRPGRQADTHAPHAMCSACIAEDPERMPENRTAPIPAGTEYECVQCHKPFMSPSQEI